ncbi:hypothetical protein PVAND_001611 [Polypedilum vanderplanki]|uniref:Alpha N-terminal protein methyltransferase 1 n=1 Tax=Polypedilum vanderplanki TaxID=319348 RepID=A0A9J6BNY0_POLVA|nr:hypothetical protein PVAND_001611 [Polypedilum vanderplanki]
MDSSKDEENIINYEKSKEYWQKVDATNSGMLGNLTYVSLSDIQGSSNFLKQIFKLKPAPGKERSLDCGSGIGRVTKNLLIHEFKKVDLLEQDERFCEKAREALSNTDQLGEIFNIGLQDFTENIPTWDVVWCQWCLLYLEDNDLVQFLIKISKCLNRNGVIIIKENFTKSDEVIYDQEDASVTRTLHSFKEIVKKSNLRIIKEMKQNNFPKELFPVYMFALRPNK